MKTDKKIITDLAELRSAIRTTKLIAVCIMNEAGLFDFYVHVTKKEAIKRAVESDKFDDYRAELDGDWLVLNAEKCASLREQRRPARLATRHANAIRTRDTYQRNCMSVPDYLLKEIAATQPAGTTLMVENGTATVVAA